MERLVNSESRDILLRHTHGCSLRDPAVNPQSPQSLTRVFPQGFENVTKSEAG